MGNQKLFVNMKSFIVALLLSGAVLSNACITNVDGPTTSGYNVRCVDGGSHCDHTLSQTCDAAGFELHVTDSRNGQTWLEPTAGSVHRATPLLGSSNLTSAAGSTVTRFNTGHSSQQCATHRRRLKKEKKDKKTEEEKKKGKKMLRRLDEDCYRVDYRGQCIQLDMCWGTYSAGKCTDHGFPIETMVHMVTRFVPATDSE